MIVLPSSVALVLDLDDTLYPERDFQRSGFRAVAERVSGADFADIFEQMMRISDEGGDVLGYAEAIGGVDKGELLKLYREHRPTISLFPDAAAFLRRIASHRIEFAIATDGRSNTQRNKVRALGIDDRLVTLVISEEVGVGKPDPLVFREAVKGLSGHPSVYVADNPAKDFVTPNRLGWITIMVIDRGENIHRQDLTLPTDHRAQSVIRSFDELELA